MKKILYGAALILLAIGFGASSAKADTDQHCLSLCISNGGTADTCMSQCSYNKPQQPTKTLPDNTNFSTHHVLVAPKPAGDEVQPTAHKVKTIGRDKDYVCVNQCLQQGGQYDRCNKSCTKTDCSTSSNGCQGLLGNVPVQPPGTSPDASSISAPH